MLLYMDAADRAALVAAMLGHNNASQETEGQALAWREALLQGDKDLTTKYVWGGGRGGIGTCSPLVVPTGPRVRRPLIKELDLK